MPPNDSVPALDPMPSSLDISTPESTLTISTSGVKRTHNDTIDHRPDDQFDGNPQVTPNNKRLKTPELSHTINVGSVGLVRSNTGLASPATDPEEANAKSDWPDVLYRTRVEGEKSDESNLYYSNQRYEAWSDPLKYDDRTPASLIEMCRDVVGSWENDARSKSKSMSKDQWREKNLHIKFGEDFTIKRQRNPAMRIQDPVIRYMMKSLIKYDPGQILTGDFMIFHWPWHNIMHYYGQIEGFRDKIRSGEATDLRILDADGNDIDHEEILRRIDVLLGQVNDVYTKEVLPELQNHSTSRLAEFKKLWMLFKPGEEVLTRVNGELAAFIVLAFRSHEPGDSKTTQAPIKQFIVHVWNLRLVAGRLVRHVSQIAIDEYEDSRLIDTLPVFPCKYAGPEHEAQARRQELIERGKKYFNIIKQPHAHMDHSGLTRDLKPRIVSPPPLPVYMKISPRQAMFLTYLLVQWPCHYRSVVLRQIWCSHNEQTPRIRLGLVEYTSSKGGKLRSLRTTETKPSNQARG